MRLRSALFALALLVVAVVGVLDDASADCSADSTSGYVGFWRAWESDWCGAGVEDAVHSAFTCFDIFDQPGELAWRREGHLTDAPTIRLSALKEEINGKRIALLSTHGGEAGSGGFIAECYLAEEARDIALAYYYSHGYDGWEMTDTWIVDSTQWNEISAGGPLELPSSLEGQSRFIGMLLLLTPVMTWQ